MRFFGILPNGTAKRLHLAGSVSEDLTEMFSSEIKEYLGRESFAFDLGFTPKRGVEVFEIEEFSFPWAIEQAVTQWRGSKNLSPAEIRPRGVKALMGAEFEFVAESGSESEKVAMVTLAAFKAIDSSLIIDHQLIHIEWSQETFNRNNKLGLIVPEGLDAVYSRPSLRFNNPRTTSRFLDLAAHVVEASDTDVREVLDNEIFIVSDEFDYDAVITPDLRRRITMLQRSKVLEQVQVSEIREEAVSYDIDIEVEPTANGEAIVLPEKTAKLKQIIDLVNDYYYTGRWDGTPRRTNSARKLSRGQ